MSERVGEFMWCYQTRAGRGSKFEHTVPCSLFKRIKKNMYLKCSLLSLYFGSEPWCDSRSSMRLRTDFLDVCFVSCRVLSSPFDSQMTPLHVAKMSWPESAFKNSCTGFSYSH